GSEQLLVNNTIVDNHASATGAGMRVNLAPGLVALNTIFWGDTSGTGGEINTVDARPTVQYCDVQGGYTGIGNIAADPQLALPRLDSLKTTSPCIGAGTATSVPLVDIHGHPRPQPAGSNPDIGAEESSQDNPTFGVEEEHALPSAFVLSQNYPNPFNPTTTIRYSLPHRCTVTLLIYNTLGQLVATLVNGSVDAGYHEVQFNAGNLASGVYFYRLQAGSFTDVKKLLLME
ncbi:MAG TPA: T9SS type A sorting domain-containing protein, partial [Bacteroidota bacterium]